MEAADGGLKCFVSVNVNISGLEGPTCWSLRTRKEVGCPHLALLTGLDYLT